MKKSIKKRVEEVTDYILTTKETIRNTAKKFGISKSTVHKDIQERLKEINKDKYNQIENIFKEHIDVRHILGGESTRKKYLQIRQNSEG